MNRFLRVATGVVFAVHGAMALAGTACPTIGMAPASLPNGDLATAYTSTVTSSGGAAPVVIDITHGLLPNGVNLTDNGNGTATFSGTATQAGTFEFTITATDANGCSGGRTYAPTFAIASQTITFTSTAPVGATVGGPTYNVTATATSGLPVAFTIDASASSVCSIAGSTVSFIGVGTCVIDANQAGNASYGPAPQVQQSFAVGQGAQTITFTSTAPAAATVGGATYNVTATASSGLPVALTIDAAATSVCSIAGSTVSFIGVGNCVIDANQAGNANYTAAPQVQQSFAVGQGSQTITFTSTAPAAAAVGGPTYNVTATGGASGNPVTFTIDATATSVCSIAGSTVSFIAAGTCVIDANQAGNANYAAATQVQQSFAVGKANQTITFTSTAPVGAVVGGATYNVTATGGASGNPVTFTIDATASTVCTIAGSTVSFIGAGTCVIDANQAGNANYNAATQAQQSFAVGKGNQTITFTSTAPVGATVGGATYNVTATGGASGNPVTFTIDATASTVCTIAGSTVSFIGAGTCVIDADQAGNANYNAATQAQQSFAVGKGSQTITFTSVPPATPTVGGATYNVTATGGASGNPVTFTIDATATSVCSIAGSTVSFIGNGTCVIDANQAGNANYNPAPQVQQSFTVKSNQTITFTSSPPATPTVGGATYTVTATATSGLPVAFTIDATASAVCSIAGSVVSFTAAGTCVIDANQAGNASFYAAPQVQQSFTVKNGQTITFTSAAPANATYLGPTYTVTATATSGLPVAFTIDATATSVCSIAGSTVSFIGTGICVIDANQAGNASFYPAPQVQQSFGVHPGAVNDPYTALGNVFVDSSTGPGTPFSVTDNDSFPAGTTISAFDAASVNLGTVTMVQAAGATMGRFTYNPPVGFTGNDTFTYTLSSNGQTAVGTVTFTVTGKVWFINDNAGACPAAPCNGRQTNPFTDASTFQAVNNGAAGHPAANDPIFVFSSATNYSGAITLLNGQRLIGQGAAGTLVVLGAVTPQNGQVLPATGGAAPVLTSAGVVVTVGTGNFIHGLTLGNGTTALLGSAFGTLTMNDNVVINTNGQGINLTNGTLTATLNSVTSTGGVNNINLVQLSGTSNLGGGALSGATGTSFAMGTALAGSGGGATITYTGTITQATNAQAPIIVQNRTGGTLSLSGSVTATAAGVRGISLLTNPGSTTNFTGAITLTTTTNAAFTATGGGTVSSTNATSTLSTTTGTALNVANTTIGAAGLTFRSIDAGTAASGPTNGIILNTTGAGGLSVTGTGAAGTGGTIQRTVQGALFTSTSNLSLAFMNFTNANSGNGTGNNIDGPTFNNASMAAINMSGVTTATFDTLVMNGGVDNGINGQNVSALTLTNTSITGFGNNVNENAVRLFNLTGTCAITNSTFSFPFAAGTYGDNLIDIRNNAGALTLTVQGNPLGTNFNTFSDTQSSANGGAGLSLTAVLTATANLTVRSSKFTRMKTTGIQTFARDTSTMNVTVSGGGVNANGNTFDPVGGLGRGVDVNAEDTAQLNFNINNNPKIYGNGGPVINVFGINNAVIQGHINNNPDIRGGGDGQSGSPIFLHPEDNASGIIEVIGNTISGIGNDPGIFATPHGDGGANHNATLDATVQSNTLTIANTNPGGVVGIDLRAGSNAGDTVKTCVDVMNNAVTLGPSGGDAAFLTREGSSTAGDNLYLEGMVAGASNQARATNTWNGRSNTPNSVFAVDAGGAAAYTTPPAGAPYNGVCRSPTNPVL